MNILIITDSCDQMIDEIPYNHRFLNPDIGLSNDGA